MCSTRPIVNDILMLHPDPAWNDSLLNNGRFADFCAECADQMPDKVLRLSDAIFEYDLGIHGQPRSIPRGKPITNMLQMIGCAEDGQWQFALPALHDYRISKDGDPLNSYVDNVLVHRVNSARMLYRVLVFDGDVVDTLSSDFLRLEEGERRSAPTEDNDKRGVSEGEAGPAHLIKGPTRRPLELIGRENENRVKAGGAGSTIAEESKCLLEWATTHLPHYVETFATEKECRSSIRTHLYKMQGWGRKVTLPITD